MLRCQHIFNHNYHLLFISNFAYMKYKNCPKFKFIFVTFPPHFQSHPAFCIHYCNFVQYVSIILLIMSFTLNNIVIELVIILKCVQVMPKQVFFFIFLTIISGHHIFIVIYLTFSYIWWNVGWLTKNATVVSRGHGE